eukprot:CAMPEP_0167760912 /NCGR_PEP_ID=MMETSP0110_2-20121227/11859_1 /TAXON_ID=629695 /ORGANISM="Gymnochlora sp., Strain CCMP2014" /LENGTH=106 /DNA_ID=CAMNT_0007647495 /DNA_START=1 /DNA_END=321 /DNA_ORIENTATION=+
MTSQRIPCDYLGDYVGQFVRIVGTVLSFSSTEAKIAPEQGKTVVIKCEPGETLDEEKFKSPVVEVIGNVADKTTIVMIKTFALGDKFDLELYNNALKYKMKYSEAF